MLSDKNLKTVVQTTIVTTAAVVAVATFPRVAGVVGKQERQTVVLQSGRGEPYIEPTRANVFIDPEALRWARFQALVSDWKEKRGARSSITEGAMMPPYQGIIGMGADAVPMILRQLESEGNQPDQWFWALRAITGENPVDPSDRGDFSKMAQAWLRWGENLNAG